MQEIHFQRLLNVARALRESPKPDNFTMEVYFRCGTPACAFGHYVARSDLQDAFTYETTPYGGAIIMNAQRREFVLIPHHDPSVHSHFGITLAESIELFEAPVLIDTWDEDLGEYTEETEEPGGCGDARDAIEAAEYIEEFVARKRSEQVRA